MNKIIEEGLTQFKKLVPTNAYIDDPQHSLFEKARIANPEVIEPEAFIFPENDIQIKAILAIANNYGIGVWPVGKGKNSGFGSATAKQSGNIIMVLERMNKIIEVNETLAYAVVEPGVTFQQLHDYLVENKINLSIDAIDGPADGSVLGNALERGRGGTNYGDHFANLCGLEMILPNGETVRTGGGPENSQTLNTYKYGVGPSLDGLFTQGNFGVATQGGIWLMPKHECCTSIFFELHSSQQLMDAISIFQTLQLEGVIESTVRLGTEYALLAGVLSYPHELAKNGFLNQDALSKLRKQYNVGLWGAAASIYGSKEVVKVKRKRIKQAFKGFGPIAFVGDKQADFLSKVIDSSDNGGPLKYRAIGQLLKLITGKELRFMRPLINIHNYYHMGLPTDHAVERGAFGESACPGCEENPKGGLNKQGIVWFAPVVPNRGDVIHRVNEHCKKIVNDHRFDYASGIFLYGPRSGMVIMKIIYDTNVEGEAERAKKLLKALHNWVVDDGLQVYRASVSMMDYVLDCNPGYKQLIGQIKRSVDPNNILAPGKYGIGEVYKVEHILSENCNESPVAVVD